MNSIGDIEEGINMAEDLGIREPIWEFGDRSGPSQRRRG